MGQNGYLQGWSCGAVLGLRVDSPSSRGPGPLIPPGKPHDRLSEVPWPCRFSEVEHRKREKTLQDDPRYDSRDDPGYDYSSVLLTIAEGWVRVEDDMPSNAGYFTGLVKESEEI